LTGLKSLNRLNIKDTLISDTGLQYLKDIPLNHLVYRTRKITDKGLGYLSNMPSLTILYVSETAISNAGVERLKDMIQLDILFLANTQIDRYWPWALGRFNKPQAALYEQHTNHRLRA